MSDLFDLSGKVALVTGGSRGLGRAIALRLEDHGADLIIVSRKLDNCEVVAGEAEARGLKALALSSHMSRWAQIETVIAASQPAP